MDKRDYDYLQQWFVVLNGKLDLILKGNNAMALNLTNLTTGMQKLQTDVATLASSVGAVVQKVQTLTADETAGQTAIDAASAQLATLSANVEAVTASLQPPTPPA